MCVFVWITHYLGGAKFERFRSLETLTCKLHYRSFKASLIFLVLAPKNSVDVVSSKMLGGGDVADSNAKVMRTRFYPLMLNLV